jgi:hypothetical protein
MGPGEQLFNNPVNPPNSVPLEKGQSIIAPWDGAIVHRDRLINFGLKIIALRRLRWLDRLRFRELSTIESNYRNSLVENTAHFNEQLATVCNQNLMNSTAWYRSWWFGLTIGLVIGFGVTLGISYIFIAN